MTGRNWKSFKDLKGDVQILSGPTLLPLTKYYRKTVVIGHDLYFLHHKGESLILQIYMKKMYKLFKNSKYIVVNSEYTKKEFMKNLQIDESRISVVYPAFDEGVFHTGTSEVRNKLNIKEGEVVLLSVGGDNPNKNVETIIKMLSKLPDNYKLIRVGRNFNTIKLISDLDLSKRVILLGNIDIKFLSDLYRGSDVLVFPSLYEGFGIPVVEAMASGIPVITSNRASLPEVAQNAGVICDPFDTECMFEAIMKITTIDSVKNELIKKGLERAKTFSSESQFKALIKVLELVDREK